MEKQYDFDGCKVTVLFQPKLVQIIGSEELLIFLNKNLNQHTLALAKLIKADYLTFLGKPLKITNASLMVEIWGHLYASQFAKALKEIINYQMISNFSDFIIKRSDTIDCGEMEIDSNRKFWDVLSKFKSVIIKFLPKPSSGKKL